MPTPKITKTKDYRTYNSAIIRRLRKKYGISPRFIYASLRGNRKSETSSKICEDYKIAEEKIIKVLENL